jgi:SAM-dependent methyltransferase
LAEIGRGERLFEPGCGAGRFTQMLAERVGPTGRVDACEMAPRMIEAAMGRVREDWAHIHRVSALEVALPLGGVDAILCFNLWPHLTRLDEHLARFASLLRPSGRLVVAHSLCRESVNAIHGMVAPKALCVRELPPAEQLAADLEALGWRPRKAVDEEVYFVSCGPPEEPKD